MSVAAHPLEAADQAACELPAQDSPVTGCPLAAPLAALEVLVVGDDDAPLPGVGVELRKGPREALRSKADRAGIARFEGLEPGAYEVGLYELDRDAWASVDRAPIPAAPPAPKAAWREPPAADTAARVHTVQPGDSVASLSQQYGHFPDTVWSAPENAALKATRADRNILSPGDRVTLPARRPAFVPANTGFRHRLRRKGVPEVLKIRFLDAAKAPRKHVAYVLELENARGDALPVRDGETDGDGVLTASVPLDATRAKVTLGPGAANEVFEFALGHVDPIDTASGVRARLESLGYLGADGGDPAATEDALRRFQADRGLAVNGQLDAATRSALLAAYTP